MSFPITCTACHKTFTISDEIFEKKVSGRVVTIKCKSCGQGIRVDGTKGGGAAAAPAPAPAPAAAPAVATPAAAAASPEEPLWAVDYPDGQDREFTTAEVIAELERGAIERATLVWRDGMGEWLELHQVPELAADLAKIEAKKKAAAAAKAAKAAPVHKPRAPMPTVTGMAGLPLAPKPRAPQPSSPELPKPRDAEASSPELATPPAPKAAPPPPPPPIQAQAAQPRPAPPAPPTPLPSPVPPPMPAPPRMPALPAMAMEPEPTPPLPPSVAKVVSRPPDVPGGFPVSAVSPAAFGAGPALVTDHASVEWPQAKSKTPLLIGGVVAAVAVAGILALVLGGKEEPPPPSAPISALPANPASTPAAAPTPTPAAQAPSGDTGQTGSDTASGSDPIATAPDPGATPGAGFAELFAAGARKAESKGATVAPTNRFEAAATKTPLADAATQAQACKQSGGPTGKVTVVVTFDPNGKVSGATITDAPFAGTATAACIASAMKRASIPPFSGLPGTVSKTFSVL